MLTSTHAEKEERAYETYQTRDCVSPGDAHSLECRLHSDCRVGISQHDVHASDL